MFRKFLAAAFAALLLGPAAFAQETTGGVPQVAGQAALTSGHVFVGSASNVATDKALAGDCSLVAAGTITCTKTNGVSFAASATTDTTSATNITTGTLGAARLPTIATTIMGNDGGQTVAAAASTFAVLSDPATTNFATEANAQQLTPAAGTLKNFYCETRTAPGVGQTFTITLRVNAASPASGPVCTISGAATTGNDTSRTATVSAGDNLNVQIVSSAGAASTGNLKWGIELYKQPN